MTRNLNYPEYKVIVGDYILTEGLELECYSSIEAHTDWCSITLNQRYNGILDIVDMDVATVELGCDGNFDQLISGFVRKSSKDYWKELLIKDAMIKLERTFVTATFLDVEPQDVIKYGLSLAGITEYKISTKAYAKKKVYAIVNKNIVDILRELESYWNLTETFYFRNGVFYWGIEEEQENTYVLEYGNSILRLNKYNELWEIETIGIPWIHCGQIIEIVHPKFNGEVRVFKVRLKVDKQGFVRMSIFFKGEVK